MNYSIDEIYNLFMWDDQLSDEENEAKEQKGIDAAKQIKNLFPFILPIVIPREKSKLVWEPCAKVVAMRSDEELQPYILLLLEWLKDINWPGGMIIYDRLKQFSFSSIEFEYNHSHVVAEQTNDTQWLYALDNLHKDMVKTKKA